jgi:hypothetical protein
MHQSGASNQQKNQSHPLICLLVRLMFSTSTLKQLRSELYLLGQQKEFVSLQVRQ